MAVMKAASDYFYEKILLQIFGLGYSKNIFYKMYGICLLIIMTIHQGLVFQGISKLSRTFDELIINLAFGFGTTIAVITTHYFYWNQFKIEKLFETMDGLNTLSNCDNGIDGNGFMLKYKILVKKQGCFAIILLLSASITVTILCSILSLNKEEWIIPFGCGIDVNDNNVKFLTNVMSTTILAVLNIMGFVMYANTLTFTSGHCKLFQKYIIAIMVCHDTNSSQNIQNQNQESKNDFQILNNAKNVIEWETFKIKLRKLIPYHIGIYEAGAEIENVFNIVLLVWFGGLSICSCLVLYHITTVNILSIPGLRDLWIILVINTSMILISFWGEQITTESEKIASLCYEVDFVGADLRIQKFLSIIMLRAQRPVVLTFGKVKILNLNTMLGILQSTYSYYTILRNLTTE